MLKWIASKFWRLVLRYRTWLRCFWAIVVFLGLSAWQTATAETLRYEILRDGSDVGAQVVEIAGDQVTVTMEVSVKALFVTVYRRTHRRVETWDGGNLVHLEAETDDDGTPYSLQLVKNGEGYERTVNGTTESFGADFAPVPDWNRALATGKAKGLSAQSDEIYDPVMLENLGTESITVPAGTFEAEHLRTGGAFARDLWYDDQGRLLLMTFVSRDSQIEYRRR
ncbi:hypothetical protein ABIE63_002164 [Limibacillus sp. MBR-115]|jgi:hypothetical protein